MVKNKGIIIAIPIAIISIIITVIVFLNAPSKYEYLFLIPFCFAIMSLLLNRVYKLFGESIVYSMVLALVFLKYVFIPLLMSLGDGGFRAVIDTGEYMFSAILLEIYELISIMILLYVMYHKVKRHLSIKQTTALKFSNNSINTFVGIVMVILMLICIIILIYPQLKSYFTIGFLTGDEAIINNARLQIQMKNSVPVLVFYLYTFFANLLRWVIPLAVIFKMYISAGSERIRTVVSLIVVIISSIITTDTIAVSVFIFTSLSLLVLKLYKSQRKIIILVAGIFITIFGVGGLFIKSFGMQFASIVAFSDLSRLFQAYFNGPENVAVALAINEPISLEEYAGNIFGFIPYVKYFFKDLQNSNVLFNQTYWGNSETVTQIIPTIGQGARCLSPIFAPVFTLVFIWLAIKQESQINKRGLLFEVTLTYIYCMCFSLTWAMYNASLTLQLFLNTFFPVVVLLWFSMKVSFRIGKKK